MATLTLMIKLPQMKEHWIATTSYDGAVHIMPTNEEHTPDWGCICDPVQQRYYIGGVILTHRSLSC